MGCEDVDDLRDNVAAIDLHGGSDLAFVTGEHPAVKFGSVSKFRDRLARFDQWSLFYLGIVFLRDRIEILVTHEVNGNLLRQFACSLLRFASFNDRANRFL